MKKIVLFSLVGLLILLLGGCGLMPFATPEVEQPSIGEPPEVPEGLEIELDPAVNLELAQTKGSTRYIPSDTEIGTWDSVNRIYTLTTDVNESIYIMEGFLTLDGAGHTITGSGSGYGVYLYNGSNVTVKNCIVSDFGVGICLILGPSNTLTDNTANSNNSYGILLRSSSSNQIYNNNFINNSIQASVEGGSGNEFSLEKPNGGNYWSDWTSPDNDSDGFWDNPYVFAGGQDNFPWVCQDGWKPTGATVYLIITVESFELPKGIEKSLTMLLKAAINSLENYHEQAAIGQLTGFIRHVEAQNGKKLTEEQAQTLIAAAQRIIDSIQ